jgi:Ca-activated chloride channel family protein
LPKNPEVARTVIVVTDGYVTVEDRVFALVRKNLGNSNVFAFGIGSSVNRHLIEGIARAGQGEPFIVTKPQFAQAQAERLRKMIDAPVLTSVRARFEGLDVYDVEPARLDALPDVLGGRPVAIFGKWRGTRDGSGALQTPRGQLVLEGRAADGNWQQVVAMTAPDADAQALRLLWARQRIQQLSDEEALRGGGAQREAITTLGLQHSLLTQYTSFIAVDHVVRNPDATPLTSVNQPLPLPQGVSNQAVGSLGTAVPSTPEPAAWFALLVALGLVAVGMAHARRHR